MRVSLWISGLWINVNTWCHTAQYMYLYIDLFQHQSCLVKEYYAFAMLSEINHLRVGLRVENMGQNEILCFVETIPLLFSEKCIWYTRDTYFWGCHPLNLDRNLEGNLDHQNSWFFLFFWIPKSQKTFKNLIKISINFSRHFLATDVWS